MSELPIASNGLTKAEKLDQLRRKMAAIPARSEGTAPAMPAMMLRSVDEPAPIVATAQTTLRTLPVPSPIAELLPRGGLARATVVSVAGTSSVLVGLLASVTAAGSHAAVIGMPDLSLLAAVEQGADLSKIAILPAAKDSAVEVAAILLDGVDLVILGLSGATVTPSRARAVVARARSKGAVLLVTEGRWDGVDLRIESRVRWILRSRRGARPRHRGATRCGGRRQRIPMAHAAYGDPQRLRFGGLAHGPRGPGHRPRPLASCAVMNTDSWTERWPEHPVIRTFDPPRPVQVDISKALPLGRGGAARADYVSMRVKSSAVYLSGLRPALQTHWFKIHDGQWLACTRVRT